ncbi:hypothetical protein OC66_00825 [Flavobacterium psychrophilum]|uniref:T9SS sorting signal type C domain-containing protein n=1 Tax=Flavobacterium psychrophilum TaxID=96345 RepID=UPI000A3BD47B|nr:T9SS sorting signal type C domain-containing protein [Flavobacterium psychrophilum]EKT4543896.1 T9SS type A sorting domain-containing protein [Flavobacterium psychrophilum]OUD29993.1 hypothetical protein FPG1W08_07180 [Flavobacterium psychrophilum]ROO23314.1 hypothetical protein OC66_00825 [Flavobacterium psychrophilum]
MNQNYFQKKDTKACFFVVFAVLLLLNAFSISAQTTIIGPATGGGFEAGTTFAANGWSTIGGSATQNVWFDGTSGATGFSGSRCAYISNTAGGAHLYDISSSRASFLYRNITIPAGEVDISLSFKWINAGESSYDKIRVWVVPTTFTPTSGTAISASGAAPTGIIQIGGDFSVKTTWTSENLLLPSAYAGTTVRLVFEWTNDSSIGAQPPGAIDDVLLVSKTTCYGSGIGTTTLGCPNTVSGGLGLGGSPAPTITCSTAACANLEATFTPIKQTTSYTVSSIAYAPPYQFNCMKNPVSVNVDDMWSPVVNLPFNFCFYGNTYSQCVIGSNGVLTFNTAKANTVSGYSFSDNLPSTTGNLFENSIYGVYHDIDPAIGGEVGWELITLNTGCRALVASWNNVPMYSCTSDNYTGMMVLYENTNIIEVYIKNKTVCATWNGGNAIVGLQNATGTAATVAPGRNALDPDWATTNEAWRFTPSGASVPTSIKWYEGAGTSGPVVGNTAVINVCPLVTTTYTAELNYTLCNGLAYSNTAQTTVNVNTDKTWNGSLSADWNVAGNWTPSGIPTIAQAVNIPSTVNNPIIGTGVDALACSVKIQSGAILTVNSGFSITVANVVNVLAGGTFNIKNTGSLVQTNNVTNSGNINMERIANLRLQDYCYWSSPVGNLLAGTFPVQSVSPLTPAGFIYKWGTTAVNTNGGFGNWISTTENMIPTTGYILRAPNGFTNAAPSALKANFIGTPNNGIFTPSIIRGTDVTGVAPNGIIRTIEDDNWNLIGNPYPSAIDALTFLNLAANNMIDGSIRLWTHGTLPSTGVTDPFYADYAYNYTDTDYIIYNKLGASAGPSVFNGKIAAGQSFLVLMNNGPAGSGTVTFNNTMRVTNNNSQFYKKASFTKNTTEEKHRFWIDLISPTTTANRILIGYANDATHEKENLYDAITDYKSSQNFYSLINDEPMVIQGRALPFDINDNVPVGIKIPANGTYKIAIAAVDAMFAAGAQTIYLEDKFLNVIHNLTETPYQFTAVAGITNNRFVIRYTENALSNNDFNYSNNINVFANNGINIISTKENIKDVVIYDVLGKTLLDKKSIIKNEVKLTELPATTSVLIVKVTLENNKVVIKKVIY